MVIDLIVVGKTDSQNVAELVEMYRKRINFYLKFNIITIPDIKGAKLSQENQKREEGALIMKQLSDGDYVVLLDDKGAQHTSMEFATWIQKRMSASTRRLCFIVGGPYGFAEQVQKRADGLLSLSKMTFSHQIVRTIFTEQLYRAFTILNNEPYHHE